MEHIQNEVCREFKRTSNSGRISNSVKKQGGVPKKVACIKK